MAESDEIANLRRELENDLQEAREQNPRVDSYRVPKIPKFIASDPGLWFAQVESSFSNANIVAERTKADHVMAQLEPEILISIRDILMKDPRPADIYTQFRTRIIGSYSVSAEVQNTSPITEGPNPKFRSTLPNPSRPQSAG